MGIGMWNSRPPPFMEKSILSFHFHYVHPSLRGGGGIIKIYYNIM